MMKSATLLVQGERANRAKVCCDPPCESLPAHLRDCLAGMARLPSAEIDLVVTSPPYNLNVKYGQYSDRQGFVPYETIG